MTLFESVYKKQKIIARNIAEAELYAAALGAPEAKGVESMMSDLGFEVKPVFDHRCKSNKTHPAPTWNRETETHRRDRVLTRVARE